MADESLIEEMRVAIRGDRERAEQRCRETSAPALAADAASPPEDVPLPENVSEPAVEPEPEAAPQSAGRWGWLRRRRDH